MRVILWTTSVAMLLAAAACGSDESSAGSGGMAGSGGTAGMAGSAGSDAGTPECMPTADVCFVNGPSGPGAACMAKADFSSAAVTQLRATSHQVKSPAALAEPFVQDGIITKKSALAEPECHLNGSGQFNLLMEIDSAQKQLTIGGGIPQALAGAPKDGTCYASFTDTASGLVVKPETQGYSEESDGSLSATFPSFVMPIYLADTTTADSYVLVPLHDLTVNATLSADKNCIGRYAAETLDPGSDCQPAAGEFAWKTGGHYEGYITVEEADKVFVVSLGETLCVLLTGDPAMWKGPAPEASCKTSVGFTQTGGLPKGDWCSTTNSAGGCQDAWRLVIDVAAQAIPIKGVYPSDCP